MTMASPITPEAALGWLRSLSVDIRAAAILDAAGSVLAGDTAIAAAKPGRGVIVAQSDRYVVVLTHGRKALAGLLRADAEAALAALERP